MFDNAELKILKDNINRVKERIEQACDRCGRSASDIQLIAVTKYGDAQLCQSLAHLGLNVVGENRVPHLQEVREQCEGHSIDFHFIGHLQRNKVNKLGSISLLHSLDSLKLAAALNQRYVEGLNVLVQVNISNEQQKSGLAGDELADFLEKMRQFENISIVGLMGMAPFGDLEAARLGFRQLKQLQTRFFEAGHPQLKELSMGMSQDFEIAIEEGATMLRLGRILYQGMAFLNH